MKDHDGNTRSRRLQPELDRHLDLRDGEVLAGWVIVYETARLDDRDPVVGYQLAEGFTEWRALGLLAWAEALLGPADDEDDDGELEAGDE